jgi:hypothetical protein
MRIGPLAAAILLLTTSAPPAAVQDGVPPVFASSSILAATIEAPFADLIENGRRRSDYAVTGTLTLADDGGRETSIENVKITTRGHTSLRESECTFPKLKLDFADARVDGTIFDDVSAVKIGTHCSDKPDGPGGKYGRWPNEKAAHREAFVYRLLEATGAPSLKARPARLTYVESRGGNRGGNRASEPLVRDAFLLEDDAEALERYGARRELSPKQFGSAPSVFAMPDLAKVFFGEAMIGNFDWCLRMSPGDTYRCNDTTPIWNVLGLIRSEGMAVPVMHDFDIAGMVTMRHPWFDKVFNRAFAESEAEVEVLAQVQRTRSVFPRDLLDATRRELIGRKAAAYEALADSPMDEAGRVSARTYLDAFYRAIEADAAFYRPVIVERTPVVADATSSRAVCSEEAPPGTAVSEPLETSGGKSRVVLLDTLWQWAEKCEAVRVNPVWIPTAVIGEAYPQP